MEQEGVIKAPGNWSFAGIAKASIGNIAFIDDNRHYKFEPQEDMTGYEAAMLAQMFAVASTAARSMTPYDYMGYLKQHNLTRHFKEQS